MVKLKLPVTSLRTKLVAITLSDPDKFKDTQTLSNLLAAPNFLAAAQYTCRPTTMTDQILKLVCVHMHLAPKQHCRQCD